MKKVYLEWIDSEQPTDGGWLLPSQITDVKPTIVKTLGFVYREDDDHYVIVSNVAQIGCVSGLIAIPKIAVSKALEIELEEE